MTVAVALLPFFMNNNFICLFSTAGITNGQHYTDCERPPKVENANAALFIDDEGTFATATYSCGSGYELHGEPELICNADTDVWKGELPSCKPGITTFYVVHKIDQQ